MTTISCRLDLDVPPTLQRIAPASGRCSHANPALDHSLDLQWCLQRHFSQHYANPTLLGSITIDLLVILPVSCDRCYGGVCDFQEPYHRCLYQWLRMICGWRLLNDNDLKLGGMGPPYSSMIPRWWRSMNIVLYMYIHKPKAISDV